VYTPALKSSETEAHDAADIAACAPLFRIRERLREKSVRRWLRPAQTVPQKVAARENKTGKRGDRARYRDEVFSFPFSFHFKLYVPC
jgi:hypothetical protein